MAGTDPSTAHSRNATTYSATDATNNPLIPIRGTIAAGGDHRADLGRGRDRGGQRNLGGATTELDDPQGKEREPGEHPDVGQADREQDPWHGRVDRERLANRAAASVCRELRASQVRDAASNQRNRDRQHEEHDARPASTRTSRTAARRQPPRP